MEITQLTVVVAVVLLPGIIAATITDKLAVHSKWGAFKFILYSFELGILSYAALQFLVYCKNLLIFGLCKDGVLQWTPLSIWSIASGQSGQIKLAPWEIIWGVALAVPLAFLVSACIQHKVVSRIGQKLRVTSKYGDENLYSYYLNSADIDWVYVRDIASDLTYEGRVTVFSEKDKIQELLLSFVRIYRYSDSTFLYEVPQVYLARESGRLVIETIPQSKLTSQVTQP